MAKSDAFDVNALPIKVGRLRLRFEPRLWAGPGERGWAMALHPANGTVTITTAGGAGYTVTVAVDANSPVLRVVAAYGGGGGDGGGGAAAEAAAGAKVTAALEMYDAAANWARNESRPYTALADSTGGAW